MIGHSQWEDGGWADPQGLLTALLQKVLQFEWRLLGPYPNGLAPGPFKKDCERRTILFWDVVRIDSMSGYHFVRNAGQLDNLRRDRV